MKPGTGTVAMVAATLLQASEPLQCGADIFSFNFREWRGRRLDAVVALAFEIVEHVENYEHHKPEKTRPEKPWAG